MRNQRRPIRRRLLAALAAVGIGFATAVVPATAANASTPFLLYVTEIDGVTPVHNATVYVTPWPSGAVVAFGNTDIDGEWQASLTPGSYRYTMTKNGFAQYTSSELVIGGSQVENSVSMLPQNGVISGRLVDAETDAPVAAAQLLATRVSDGFSRPGTTDLAGNFAVDWLPAGDFELYISKFGSEYEEQWYLGADNPGDASLVSVSLHSTTSLGDVPMWPTGAALSGTVTSAETGDPFWPTNAGVRVYRAGESPWIQMINADEQGQWSLSGLAPGDYEVELMAPVGHLAEWFDDARNRAGATAISLSRGEVRDDIHIAADTFGSISGTVTSVVGGVALGNIVVEAFAVGGGPALGSATTGMGLGTYTLSGLPAGDYVLSFTPLAAISPIIPEWYDGAATSAAATPVTVIGGQTTAGIDAVMTPGAQIYGTVTAASDGSQLEGITVDVLEGSAVIASAQSGATGNVYVSRIPPGEYTVRFSDSSGPYLTQWFDGAASQGSAQSLVVEAGDVVFDIDASLTRTLATTSQPTITGTPQIGAALFAATGSWSPTPLDFSFQWRADGAPIAGATSSSFAPSADELGAEISVSVTGSRTGFVPETRTSEPTTPVIAGELTLTPVPTIGITGGTLAQAVALTSNSGTWTPAPVTLERQWLRDGEPIVGATGTVYVTGPADAGADISLRVTGSKPGYTSVVRTSDPVGPVPFLELTSTPVPTIVGTPEVGQSLTANPGAWAPAPVTLAYQWLRDGSVIDGATDDTYTLVGADLNRDISVRVLATKPGYSNVTRTSDAIGPIAAAPGPIEPDVSRLAGADRFETAVQVSQQWAPFAPGEGVVYLANAFGFADALSAAPAAAAQDAPLLLTRANTIPDVVVAELQRLNPATVKVVGGAGVVSNAVISQLAAILPAAQVDRVSGIDRYETSRAITLDAFGDDGSSSAFIATGRSFPDALSASAAAGSLDAPVILVDGSQASIDAATEFVLNDLGASTVYIAGGIGVVTQSIQNQIDGFAFTSSVVRLAGDDRYSTAQAINAALFTTAPAVYLATGIDFPDALAGAALAGSTPAPLFVVRPTCVHEPVLTQIADSAATEVILLGGTGVLTPSVAALAPC